jgi:hypothetical protein
MLLLQNSTKQYSTNSSLPVNESNVMNMFFAEIATIAIVKEEVGGSVAVFV